MDTEVRREIRLLKGYAIVLTISFGVLALAAFTRSGPKTRFSEIDAERINIVEADGKLRLTLSNSHRLPEVVVGGKSYPLRGGTGAGSAGLIFFNDEGNENGGLVWAGKAVPGGHRASAHLTFDQFNQDETVALSYADVNGQRHAGLMVADRSETPIQVFAESAMAIRRLPADQQARRMEAFRQSPIAKGGASSTRLFAGKMPDKSATVSLSDPQGRARLRLVVDSLGAARIEFLDAAGKVTDRYPPAR